MNDRRRLAVVGLTLLAGLAACGPRRVETPEPPPLPALLVLLPDPETGTVGRVVVTTPAGQVDLDAARASTQAFAKKPPTPVTILSEADVQRLFGDALGSLPPPPQSFTLFFRFESDELTDESRALVPEILQAVKNRPFPEVAVRGHTDTTGTSARNFELGLKRANMVRTLLVETGLDPTFVDVTSHGEVELLVPTPDETYEARNRRVEITIR
jgi:outer membrane protein OmpA-like peptidoglycan-associated protein